MGQGGARRATKAATAAGWLPAARVTGNAYVDREFEFARRRPCIWAVGIRKGGAKGAARVFGVGAGSACWVRLPDGELAIDIDRNRAGTA